MYQRMEKVKTCIKNGLYVLAAIGCIDVVGQAWTGGDLKIIRTVLGWIVGY